MFQNNPMIVGVGTALPSYYATQQELSQLLQKILTNQDISLHRIEKFHQSVQVHGRYLALEPEAYPQLKSFTDSNRTFLKVGLDLAEKATAQALEHAGLRPCDIDQIIFTTVTGLAVPSLDARLINRMGFRNDVKRVPIFGWGCLGGAAGLSRAADYLRGFPKHRVLLVSVELCSLTLQREDFSVANFIATGLFGDGAAAVILEGADMAQQRSEHMPAVVGNQSFFYPNTEHVMGWNIGETGFQIVLSADVPKMVGQHLRNNVDTFLESYQLSRTHLKHVIAHTGGPKVLEAISDVLRLPSNALERSWKSLHDIGNLSSASVLFVLKDLLNSSEPQSQDLGLLFAMGPGFCSEMVLLTW